jgi:hypothetical protein
MATPHNCYTVGATVIAPVAGVHALELRVTPAGVVARLRTNGVVDTRYTPRVVDAVAEIARLESALRGGPTAFVTAITATQHT